MAPQIVPVPRGAFAFCRISLTVLLWTALALRQPWLVGAVAAILLLSALLRVDRSPMVRLHGLLRGRRGPASSFEFLDVAAMRFAHGLGALLALGVLAGLWRHARWGWGALLAFCLLKTISALGFCPASRLFACLRKGGCCAFTGRRC